MRSWTWELSVGDHIVLIIAALAMVVDGLVLAVILWEKIQAVRELRRQLASARAMIAREDRTPVEGIRTRS
jgi:hypothetical protein